MKRVLPLVILIALPVTGCGVFGGGPSPDAGLAFGVPTPSSLTYVVGDTANVEIETGMMGTMAITTSSSATLAMDFAPSAVGAQVTATFQEYSARQTNPMSGATTANQSSIDGPMVFNLDRRGHVEVVEEPDVSGTGVRFFPSQIVYQLFPLLPGGAMEPGDSWVDTVAYQIEYRGFGIAPTYAFTYTLQGDTTVAGQRLQNIGVAGDLTVEMYQSMEGMDVSQGFAGTLSGTVLWDPVGGRLHSQELERTASGTVEVPSAGMPPMPLTVNGSLKVRLQGG